MEAPIELKKFMAEKNRRMHHYLWHMVRNGWEEFKPEEKEKLKNLKWDPPRPSRKYNSDGSVETYLHNNSGQDFLYMHREMIRHADLKLQQLGNTSFQIKGWKSLPEIDDPIFPVPPPWTINNDSNEYFKQSKSDEFFEKTMKNWEKDFTDSNYLKSVSLGELGARIEFTLHNRMHVRWSKKPVEMRPETNPYEPETIDDKWNNYNYDFLGDEYSAHVNSTFWKIHGWVDDRINDWAKANDVTNINWEGTWLGPMPHHGDHHLIDEKTKFFMDTTSVEESFVHDMEKALKIVLLSDVRCHFYDRIDIR